MRKIDGWCPWHPEIGWGDLDPDLSKDDVERDLRRQYENSNLPNRWLIKPVHIVDASPDSAEVVVPRELVEFIERWRPIFEVHEAESYSLQHRDVQSFLYELNQILPTKRGEG